MQDLRLTNVPLIGDAVDPKDCTFTVWLPEDATVTGVGWSDELGAPVLCVLETGKTAKPSLLREMAAVPAGLCPPPSVIGMRYCGMMTVPATATEVSEDWSFYSGGLAVAPRGHAPANSATDWRNSTVGNRN